MVKKYINKIKMANRPFDDSATISARGGGSYQNMYSKSLQKLIVGQVALQHSDTMTVPCNLVNSDSLVTLYGSISNTYMLAEYALYCLIPNLEDGTEIRIDIQVTANSSWTLNLNARQLYDLSATSFTVVLEGLSVASEDVLIKNTVAVNLGVFCESAECAEGLDYIAFEYTHNTDNSYFFEMSIDDSLNVKNTVALSIYDFITFLTDNGLEVQIWNEEVET
jgi:hypothetical protein